MGTISQHHREKEQRHRPFDNLPIVPHTHQRVFPRWPGDADAPSLFVSHTDKPTNGRVPHAGACREQSRACPAGCTDRPYHPTDRTQPAFTPPAACPACFVSPPHLLSSHPHPCQPSRSVAHHVVCPPVKDMHGHRNISVVEAQGHRLLECCQGIHHHPAALLIRGSYRLQHLQCNAMRCTHAGEGRNGGRKEGGGINPGIKARQASASVGTGRLLARHAGR